MTPPGKGQGYLTPGRARLSDLDSHGIKANADAMRELDGDLIEITHQDGQRILANVLPEGRALIEQLRAEQERERQS